MSSALDPIAKRQTRLDTDNGTGQLEAGCQMDCSALKKCRCLPVASLSLASSQETLVELNHLGRTERRMGDTELSYYLPARESGVNDMWVVAKRYLHLGCHAPPHLLERERIRLVWAILRIRHPLLASKVEMHSYDDIRFVYVPPHSAEHALDEAGDDLEYRTQNKDELIDSYLNGPRTLSDDRISYLIVSFPDDLRSDVDTIRCEFLICAAHFLGDGMALHQSANDFFGLLGSSSMAELSALLATEWQGKCGKLAASPVDLPSALESRLPQARGKFAQIASRVDFERNQKKLIGGQTFPKISSAARRTIVPTVSFDENRTKNILKRCKSQGVSISSALFAICNFAWAKTTSTNPEMPSLMYSALNLRSYLLADKALNDSYWFLAIGYFNVMLPTFLPRSGDLMATFWHRARMAKLQSTDAAKNPLTASRSREMARERGNRARAWAKEDDDKANGVWKAPPPAPKKAGPSSNALIGLSLLGNLDGMYKHSAFSEIKLDTLTTGSRQRAGGMLVFGYTFVGKLWISLGYDENGFDKEVVKRFWSNVLSCTEEFLIN
ncbi:hypothetical protein C0991_007104 [Blastosporella zonata]|nr:hypothetical protein C0991_007104 [Blastosporella zonata]